MINFQPVILCGGSGTRLWPLSRTGFNVKRGGGICDDYQRRVINVGARRGGAQDELSLRLVSKSYAG